jgi:hypothetical protein
VGVVTAVTIARHYEEDRVLTETAFALDAVVAAWFSFEIAVRLNYRGFEEYHNDRWNIFDEVLCALIILQVPNVPTRPKMFSQCSLNIAGMVEILCGPRGNTR